MARTNNEVVGTFDCKTCGTVATLHQTKRGTKKGLLYKRCGCGCNQSTGEQIQRIWREKMTPREGYEHLKLEPETVDEPAKEPTPEPKAEPAKEPIAEEPKKEERKNSRATVYVSVASLVASGLFIFILKGAMK